MSVSEIMPLIRQLSAEEKCELLDALASEVSEDTPAEAEGKPLKWPDVRARQKKIFGDRVLPNLVLQAREEERY